MHNTERNTCKESLFLKTFSISNNTLFTNETVFNNRSSISSKMIFKIINQFACVVFENVDLELYVIKIVRVECMDNYYIHI